MLVGVGHRHEFDRAALGIEGIDRCAAAAATAADQGDLDGVVFRRMDMGNGDSGQGRDRGQPAGIFEKFPTRGQMVG